MISRLKPTKNIWKWTKKSFFFNFCLLRTAVQHAKAGRIGNWCDQNGDRVSKNNKSCHICNIRLLMKYEKYGALSIYLYPGHAKDSNCYLILFLYYFPLYVTNLYHGVHLITRDQSYEIFYTLERYEIKCLNFRFNPE